MGLGYFLDMFGFIMLGNIMHMGVGSEESRPVEFFSCDV